MRKIIFLILFLAILVRIPFLSREFVLEEAFHVRAAKTVAETGYPLVYYGEQQPPTIYLDRPPGLLFLVAASFKLFGQSEMSARIVPMTFFLATLLTIFYFGIRLFPNQKEAILLAILLLAIHPYMIQNSLMIHHDGALVLFFLTLYLFLTLEKIIKKLNSWRDHLQLGIILFFALWIKYEPTLLMIATVAIFTYFNYKPFLKKLIISCLLAIVVFFASFFAYNFIMGHPEGIWLPFVRIEQLSKGSFLGKITPDQSLSLWAGSYYIGIRFLSWLGVPTILLSVYALMRTLQERTFNKDPKIIFMEFWVLFFTATYIIIGWAGDYPRYFASAMPPLFLLIAIVLIKDLKDYQKIISPQKTLILLASTVIILYFLSSRNFLFLDHVTGWIPHLQIPFFALILIGTIFILLVKNRQYLALLFLVFLLFFQLFQTATQYWHDVNAKYSLTNFYGNGPYKPAAELLKQNLPPDATILTFDPIGYYWGGKYYDYYQMGYHRVQDIKIIKNALLDGKISAIALPTEYIDQYTENVQKQGLDFKKYLAENYQNHLNFGGEKGIEVWY